MIKSTYPYTKHDAYRLFRINDRKQHAYSQKNVRKSIADELVSMSEYGFDFSIIKNQQFQLSRRKTRAQLSALYARINNCDYRHKQSRFGPSQFWDWVYLSNRQFYKFNRKIYALYLCNNDKCRIKRGRRKIRKSWTSILGNIQIRFRVQTTDRFIKFNPQYKQILKSIKDPSYPYVVEWMLKIYRQQCKDCKKWAQTYVFESQLKATLIQFCRIVTNIVNDFQPPRNKGDRNKYMDVHNHIQELCEACRLGQCYNIPKTQTQQNRKQQV